MVRHGQSAGNVAREEAEAAGLHDIAIDARDVDLPLSPLGERQSIAVGRWFAALPQAHRPTLLLCSPYVRALRTAELMLPDLERCIDERLREKEPGALERLTHAGIVAKFPHEAEQYARLGKFYYRSPGGESWCDVILRLRSVVDDLRLAHCGERVLIVAHQVIVLCFRYLLERLTEAEILAIDRKKEVANCSVTAYELGHDARGRESLQLERYDFVAPVEASGEPVTHAPDASGVR
ncbi:MAG TPA: histidine phosphatase family protein [Nannocystaceae bacterium]|nr:histidine phosphatase family protein [Nannocystaceae bacterium]